MEDPCAICGSELKVERQYDLAGAGFGPPGTESIVVMERVICTRDHHYDRVADSVEAR